MTPHDNVDHRTQAAIEFNQREPGRDGARVVNSLATGLNTMRRLLCVRLREDVEQNFGLDSLNLPLSAVETERRLEREIDTYQAAVAALHARHHGYLQSEPDWCGRWFARLQRADFGADIVDQERLSHYLGLTRQEQRLAFTNVLVKILPAGGRAPLVLFRLFPASVRVVTSQAFGDAETAAEVRTQQRAILPAIEDCPECHAALLDNGRVCAKCSNPLWSYDYLTTSF